MRPRALLFFIILNVLITTAVAFAIISLFSEREEGRPNVIYATVQMIITATRDANATQAVLIITATPRPGEVADLPTGVLEGGRTTEGQSTDEATPIPQNTLDPELVGEDADLASTVSALPQGCIVHVLQEGEFPGLLAEQYDTTSAAILAVNGLTEDDAIFLQIGQVLIIPLEGCPLDTTLIDNSVSEDTVTEEVAAGEITETPEATDPPTITPTITLPPTATDAEIVIVEVTAPGDITAESLIIRNNGRMVSLLGWTISDLEGNTYTFPERNIFTNGEMTLYTGSGQSTPVVLYWGLNQAVWGEPGDIVTLRDANGVVQAVFRINSPSNLP